MCVISAWKKKNQSKQENNEDKIKEIRISWNICTTL